MPPSTRPLLFLLVPLALAACSHPQAPAAADAPPPSTAAAAPPVAAPAVPAPPAPTPRPASGVSYVCDGGQRIEVTRDTAAVHFADGRVVDIPRDASGASRFVNEALEFAIAGDRAELAQDEGPTARCKAG